MLVETLEAKGYRVERLWTAARFEPEASGDWVGDTVTLEVRDGDNVTQVARVEIYEER